MQPLGQIGQLAHLEVHDLLVVLLGVVMGGAVMLLANAEAEKAGRKATLPDFLNAVRIVNDRKDGGVSSQHQPKWVAS